MKFSAILYGSTKQLKNVDGTINKYPLLTDIQALPNLVTVDLTGADALFPDLLGLNSDVSRDFEKKSYFGGGTTIKVISKNTWKIETKRFCLWDNDDVVNSNKLYLVDFTDSPYKYIDIKNYKIRPNALISSTNRGIAVNCTSYEKEIIKDEVKGYNTIKLVLGLEGK